MISDVLDSKRLADSTLGESIHRVLPGDDELSQRGVKDLSKVFKLLSDETRLRILLYLTTRDELHVSALCDRLAQSQPAVSHHLALLRTAGLIEARRSGKHNFYRLLPDRFEQLMAMVFDTVPGAGRQLRLASQDDRFADDHRVD